MSYGYSQRLIEANHRSKSESLGVLLGRKCIKHDISVGVIAEQLGVSRATIYNWFWGVHAPATAHKKRIEALLALTKKKK